MTKSNDSSLAIIAKCVGYMQSPKIPVAAVRILRILAKEHSSQIAHVFTSVTPDVIRDCFAEQLCQGNIIEQTEQDVRVLIIQLILENLDARDRNLSLILLGLNNREDTFNCINCILNLTEHTRIAITNPVLAESCYELFYRLLANKQTASQFYELITVHDPSFLIELLQRVVELNEEARMNSKPITGISYILQRAFLMNSLALFLHLSRTKKNAFDNEVSLMRLGMLPNAERQSEDRLILRCLQGLQKGETPLLNMGLQQWGLGLEEFEMENDPGCITYDIERLTYRLRRDQRGEEEIGSIVRKVLEVNQSRNYVWALANVHRAWANLVEVIIVDFNLLLDGFDFVLYEILDMVLERLIQSANHNSIYKDCSYPLASVSLASMKRLRRILCDTDVKISLNECEKLCDQLAQGIISQAQNNATRIPLYGAFLAFFDFCDYRPTYLGAQRQALQKVDEFMLVGSMVREEYKLVEMNRDVLKKHFPDLIDVVSLDVVSQSPLLATLSANLLSSFAILYSHPYMMHDKDHSWIFHLARNGRFARLIRGLNAEDEDLAEAIYVEGVDKTNLIYKFESVMSFLTQVARAEIGCSQLIDCSVFDLFMKATFIDSKPHLFAGSQGTSSHALHRYFQLMNPVLRLIYTMLETQSNNRSLHRAVFQLLHRHEESFTGILKDIKGSRLAALEGIQLVLSIWQQLLSGPLNVRHDINAQQFVNLQAVVKQKRLWQTLFKALVERLGTPHFVDRMDIQADHFTRGEDNAQELIEKSYDILRILVLLFQQSVSHPGGVRPMEAELIFTIDKDPNLGELLNAITITGNELEQCIKNQAELQLDSTRIEDALDKYVHIQDSSMSLQSRKLRAAQIVQGKLDAISDRLQRLSTTVELMFTVFFGHCLTYASKDPNGPIQKTLAESASKINEIAKQLRSIQFQDTKPDSMQVSDFQADFVESLAAQISRLVKKKPKMIEWAHTYPAVMI